MGGLLDLLQACFFLRGQCSQPKRAQTRNDTMSGGNKCCVYFLSKIQVIKKCLSIKT